MITTELKQKKVLPRFITHGQTELGFSFQAQSTSCGILRVHGDQTQELGRIKVCHEQPEIWVTSSEYTELLQFISEHVSALINITKQGGELILTAEPFDDSWITYFKRENNDLSRLPATLGFAGLHTLYDDWRLQP